MPGGAGGRRVGDRAAPPPPPLAVSVSRLPLGAGPLWGRGPCAFLAEILEDRFDRAPCATRHATFRRSPHPDGHLWVTNLCGLRCPTEAPAVCWDLTRGRPTRHLGPSVWPRAEDGRKEAGPQGRRCGTCPSDILNGSARLTSHAFPKANSGCFVKIRTTQVDQDKGHPGAGWVRRNQVPSPHRSTCHGKTGPVCQQSVLT